MIAYLTYKFKPMKAILQRVSNASVTVDATTVGSINAGLLILLGVAEDDTETTIAALADKILALRIFEDSEGKLNRSLLDTRGEALVVSQFTLFADCAKGNRPSFMKAAKPEKAEEYYNRFVDYIRSKGVSTATGVFRAHMQVSLVNDGPVTIALEI